jgi:hypothetical protein
MAKLIAIVLGSTFIIMCACALWGKLDFKGNQIPKLIPIMMFILAILMIACAVKEYVI